MPQHAAVQETVPRDCTCLSARASMAACLDPGLCSYRRGAEQENQERLQTRLLHIEKVVAGEFWPLQNGWRVVGW